MCRTIVFFGLITSAFSGESLDPLVNASVGFSIAIQQQLAATRSDPSPIALAAETVVYADAKAAYFNALREAAPELMNIATGREVRPPELDTMAEGNTNHTNEQGGEGESRGLRPAILD